MEVIQNMSTPVSEHDKVVSFIRDQFTSQYTVKTNLIKEENYIGSLFPDLIFFDKKTESPIFILDVRRNGDISKCIQQWKSLSSIPATLYIIVPENDLANAKSIAQVVGLQTRFGAYTITDNDTVTIRYE